MGLTVCLVAATRKGAGCVGLCRAGAEIERLNLELQKRDKCSYIGPMRDCPTHGESAEIERLKAQLDECQANLRLVTAELELQKDRV
jgi:uncharacterized small protein (DUF1192 family)